MQCYKDRAAQKAHWKFHKHSCKMMIAAGGMDLKAYEASLNSLDKCFSLLQKSLLDPKGGVELPYIIRKIRTIMDSGNEGSADMALQMHTYARGILCAPRNLMFLAMVRPGMVPLMLGDDSSIGEEDDGDDTAARFKEDLLSEKARIEVQLSKYNGRPMDEFTIRDCIPDKQEQKRVRALCKKYDKLRSSWSQPSSMLFCYLYFNLIVAAAIQGQPSMTSIQDGRGTICGSNGPDKSPEYLLAANCRAAKGPPTMVQPVHARFLWRRHGTSSFSSIDSNNALRGSPQH
jgi:hypothetical protein